MQRRTYHDRLARLRAGDPPKGPWPVPVVDRIEPDAAEHAEEWPAWGYRKIAAIAAAEGLDVGSASSVKRAMARRDLLQPVRYQAERRQLAQARREAFLEAPTRRNRVWQADFTQCETGSEGTWRLCPVVDYATKPVLACPLTLTQGATDLISALQGAVEAAEALLGGSPAADCADPDTGEITPLAVVTDNGPAMKTVAVARWFAARAHLAHVRTRHRAPHTNGAAERWINPPKYEHLYRHDITTGPDLADHTAGFVDENNTIRPHQALGQTPPLTAYPHDRTPKPNPPRNEQKT